MSSLSSISIRRPVLASVLSVVIVIFGALSYSYLGVREYPAVDLPVITVSTSYSGANADVIEMDITEPIEAQINAVSGIRTLSSISEEGRSIIRVEFGIDADLEVAANDIRDRVSRAIESLPPDANPPSIRKEDADSDPIVFLNISSPYRDRIELTQIARDIFRERLRTIDGISIVSVWGQQRPTIKLWMNPQLLAAYNISPQDIRSAIDRENIELPSGIIEGESVEMTIRTMGKMSEVEEFNNLIIKEVDGNNIRFKDIGYAEMGTRDDRSVLKRNGVPMVGVAAIPQPGANQLDARDELFRRVDLIKQDLPDDIEVSTGFDNTEFIRESINEVQSTIFMAFFLVVVIIFLFLRDLRTTIIPMIVVPISLIGSFFIMFSSGFSINVLTLLALVLSIGLVIDDAIIVLENIFAKMEAGLPAVEAGIEGTREIFFAVVATTLALVSVFVPIVFLDGVTGKLFKEFGMVLAAVVVLSSFVSLTLIPMMSVRLIRPKEQRSAFYEKTEPYFQTLNRPYQKALQRFLLKKRYTLWVLGGSTLLIALFFLIIPEEMAPLEDRSSIQLSARAPEGATFAYMDATLDQVAHEVMSNTPELKVLNTVTSQGGTNRGTGYLTLTHPDERSRSQDEITNMLNKKLERMPEARIYASQAQSLSNDAGGLPIQFVVQTGNAEELRDVIPEFLDLAQKSPVFAYVDVDLKFTRPELRIEIDRNRAAALGVSVRDIGQTLQLAYSGSRFGYFELDGRQYWVMGRMPDSERDDPRDILSLNVRNNRGELIQLDNLIHLIEDSGPPQLFRFNRMSAATFSAALNQGQSMDDGIRAMRSIAAEVLNESFSTELAGPSRDFKESASSLNFIFLLALVFIYLVLAAQFESLKHPLVILFTVPLALIGALIALWYFNISLNIFSKIGMIMLIGLVTKNGILIVEFFKQKTEQGIAHHQAIQEAALSRFRPILMTTFSTVLGTLPLVLSTGAGSAGRTAMGVAVVGGLVLGTFLTLFVIPAILSFFLKPAELKNTAS